MPIAAFARPTILPRLEDRTRARAGRRWCSRSTPARGRSIGDVNVTGTPLEPTPRCCGSCGLQPGRPYDGPAIDARIAAYEEELRERGYYEARVRERTMFSAEAPAST